MFASVKSYLWMRARARALIYLVLLHPAAAIIETTSDRAYVRAERPLSNLLDSVRFHDAADVQQRCSKENYANGSWVLTSSAKKNYLCCSTEHHNFGDSFQAGSQFCQKATNYSVFRKGKGGNFSWQQSVVAERTNQHSWPYFKFAPIGGNACACQFVATPSTPSNPHQMLDIEKYEWKPSACALEPFDAMTFCDRLKGRTLAVIGDSTGEQAGKSLINMVIGGMPSSGIGCASQIRVALSDTLINARVSPPERGINATAVWGSLEEKEAGTAETEDDIATRITNLLVNVTAAVDHGLDFVVLGSGAHFNSMETYQEMLEKIADSIEARRKKPNPPQFLWKTISGAGYGKINEESDTSSVSGQIHGWSNFKTFDRLARQKMREVSVPIVDMDMLYLRGDSHSPEDGLHFCAPGPTDVFAQVLSHMLS